MKQYVVTIYITTDKEVTSEKIQKVNFGDLDKEITDVNVEEVWVS